MVKFNESIRITVEVNTIAEMLLAQMSADFKHKEIVVESIIGRALASDKSALSRLYNALNGHIPSIDFSIGDMVVPENVTPYAYWSKDDAGVLQRSSKKIVAAKIVEIDLFKDQNIRVEYEAPLRDGTMETSSTWINHTDCKKIVLYPTI